MRDCYVGDIGDFANYGLLRVLCGTPQEPVPHMRLGIIWYKNPGEDHSGNEIGYLNPSRHNYRTFGECDPDLYAELQRIVGRHMSGNTARRIEDIIGSDIILHPDTQHHKVPVPALATAERRDAWFNHAMDNTGDSDVIFLNPDTGIDWQGRSQPTHVNPREINKLLERGKIAIIYQHQRLFESEWIGNTARNLREDTLAVQHLWACNWHRRSVRGYFIAASTSEQRANINQRLTVLRRSQWVMKSHFSLPPI